MFCPKCGVQNVDDGKFCRGCGADLSNVLASVEGKVVDRLAKLKRPKASLSERSISLYSRGIRGVLLAVGFFIVSGLALGLSERGLTFALFMMAFAFAMLATGISRFVQASGLKKLAAREGPAQLGAGATEFVRPARSFYDTDDLAATPFSVTERTTNLLRRMGEDEDDPID
jgi:hypothetical protein